jgi:tetraacyldisaccharide 4'-kinase
MALIESHWQKITPLAALLYPLSLAFRLAVRARKALYRAGILTSIQLAVPVVVVGNIDVGGTGKTPLVLWLAAFLASRGLHPGIVSRGYGGSATLPRPVAADSDPAAVGDEPVLLARRCRAPVWVGRDRAAAAAALLAAHPACDVIVCDDGLQHYRLARDVEVAVIDGRRGLGNGWMLPAGPLREPASRLASVDAVVVNGAGAADVHLLAPVTYSMSLRGGTFRNLLEPGRCVEAGYFSGRRVHAVAGIGNPGRFFSHLQRMGLDVDPHAFADHHAFRAADLASFGNSDIVMTEKDAVKCRAFASGRWWALAVDAEVDPAFGELVLRGIARPS